MSNRLVVAALCFAACSAEPDTNDTASQPLIPGADLLVSGIQAPPSAAGSFTAAVTVCNNGLDPAPGAMVELYASVDTVIVGGPPPSGDHLLGSQWVNGLASAQCATVSVNAWSPPLQGAAYLGAIVDPQNSLLEGNEANNTFVGALTGFGSGADLVVTSISAPPSANGSFTAQVRVCNQGTTSANGSNVELYASTDMVLTVGPPPAGDFLLGSAWSSGLATGQCEMLTVNAWPPPLQGAAYLAARVDAQAQVVELIEANNTFFGALTGFGSGPDVVVSAISAPPTANGSFTAQVTVCNRGTADASSVNVNLHASNDTVFDPGPPPAGDMMVGSQSMGWLGAGQCQAVSINAWTPPFQGQGYLAAQVDPNNQLIELIESNNTFVGGVMGFGSGPDLIITSISAPPTVNGAFNAVVRLCNQGTASSSGVSVELYASTDQVLSPPPAGDFPVGNFWSNGLAVGQCELATVNAWSPPLQGELRLIGSVDPFNSVIELIEINNTFVGGVIGFGSGPDLIVTSIAAPPSANGSFTAQVTLCNQGTASSSGANVDLYVTVDSVVTQGPPPGGDQLVGSVWSSSLVAGQCQVLSVNAWAPPLQGEARLATVIDASAQLTELIESNNTFVGGIMGFGSGPDLVVTAISAPPSANANFTAEVTLCNRGTAGAAGSNVELYASTDMVLVQGPPPSGDSFLGSAWSNGLGVGQCEVLTISAWSPPLQSAAYLAARADGPGQVVELVESNNTFFGSLMGFGSGPDLVVTALAAPASINGNFTAQATLCNRGTAASPGANVELYGSVDTTLNLGPPPAGDFFMASAWSSGLAPSECRLVSLQGWGAPIQGAGYLLVSVDGANSLAELIETNNVFVSAATGFGSGPDLVITGISAPNSVNGNFNATVTVCNRGTITAPSAQIELYATVDTTIVSAPPPLGDSLLGSATSGSLAAEQCQALAISAWSPPLQGAGYLGAVADPFAQVTELLESNNTFVSGVKGFGSGPDLVVTTIAAPSSVNGSFTAQITLCNYGTAASPGASVDLYASRDTVVMSGPPPAGDVLMGTAWSTGVAVGACQVLSLNGFGPPFTGAGYLGVVVDPANQVVELVESNNTFVGGVMGFGSGADLVIQTLDANPFVLPGGAIGFAYTVCNRGTVNSPSSTLGVVAAQVADASPQVPPVMFLNIPTLNAAQCSSGSGSVPVAFPEGPAFLVGFADFSGSVSELVEINNRSSDAFGIAQVFCGNGAINAGEACDDGNFVGNDGCSATCAVEYHNVWQANATGTQFTNVNWNYAMGYHFTPLTNGYITGLRGLFNGTKTVRLFDRDTGALLAQTSVTASNNWAGATIPALAVTANRRYTVAVYLAGTGGSYRSGVTFPATYGDVRIDGSTFILTTSSPSARPTNLVTNRMYGQADIRFSRYP